MAVKSNGPMGIYPRCAEHLTSAGMRNSEAAASANISVSSISRMKKQDAVLLTTISKLINALNRDHFQETGSPLDFGNEIIKL